MEKVNIPLTKYEIKLLICGLYAQIQEFCIEKSDAEEFLELVEKLERYIEGDE